MKKLTLIICLTLVSGFAFSQWIQLNPELANPQLQLNSVFFTDAKTGYIVGNGGTILKTTNGGSNWNAIVSGTNSDELKSIYFADANTGYALGSNEIIKTIDAGLTWTSLVAPIGGNSVFFSDEKTGYMVGWGGILKTVDGGTTWTTMFTETDLDLKSVYFINKNIGYAVGWGGLIIKTVDGGTTWSTIILEEKTDLNSVFFPEVNVGYAVGGEPCQGIIIKTSNGGKSWETLSNEISARLFSVFFTDINTGFIVGGQIRSGTCRCCTFKQIILKTIDGGNTWTELNSVTNELLNSVFFTDANTGYAVGRAGTILKTTNGGGLVSVAETKNLESTFTVYPNPAIHKISIATNSNLQGETIVCIFNMNGALLQQEKFQSQNLIEMDVSSLARGIYLLKIQTKSRAETKKLVVQ